MSAITHWAERHLRIPYSPYDTRRLRLGVKITGLATMAAIGLTCFTIFIILKRPKAPEVIIIGAAQQYAAVGNEVEHPSFRRQDADGHVSSPIKVQREAQLAQKAVRSSQPRSKSSPTVVPSEPTRPAPGAAANRDVKQHESIDPAAPGELVLPNRPTNIAPAEKFGFRQIGSDAIILMNGSKIALHGRFPNGEVLLRIDSAKGIVETDRRVMMIVKPAE
jgi:hypothetical protein